MAAIAPEPPSFSRRRRWTIGLDMAARTALVAAVVVMLNYLGAQFFHRFYLSAQTRVQLSTRTLSVLRALTNRVTVTLYYDRKDDFYPDIVSLLNEYRAANPKLFMRTVDPVRDAGEAEKTKEKYGLGSATDKNLIIFDAGEQRVKIANGDALIQYSAQGMSKDRKVEFGPVAFRGEMMFTAMLLALENARPFKAYFLQGDGEPSLADSGNFGYLKFGMALAQSYVAAENLDLSGATDVPADCNLLIIAAPTTPLSEPALKKISQYLAQGGRLLALFSYASRKQPVGLEPVLQRWGVNVAADYVKDPNTISGQDAKITKFGQHPVVEPLAGNGLSLQMILPRPIGRLEAPRAPPDAPQVTELAFSSDQSVLAGEPAAAARSYPLMAAVEQKNITGVANPRGATRIVAAGDSVFLGNYFIEGGGNREFLGYAVNWLLDRPQLLEGIGPRPIIEYRLQMSRRQQAEVRWILLGALPGAVLLLGGLVWLVRRK
jgi:SAM-dependent methyltransferase